MKRAMQWRSIIAAWAILFSGATAALAAGFPDKTVRLIVPYSAGGAVDSLARLIASKLSEKWGQPVVVENREGGDGVVAEEATVNSPPDGTTLLMASNTHTVIPSQHKLSYDSIKSFTSIGMVAQSPAVLVINPSLPVNSLPELLAYAKAHPGKLNYGATPGGAPWLEMQLLLSLSGTNMVDVNYKGTAPMMVALLGNEVQLLFSTVSSVQPQVAAGKLKALAISTKTRSPQMPDVPTVAEATGFDFDVFSWYGLLGPAGIPKDVQAKLHDDIGSVMELPDVQKTLGDQGFTVTLNTPGEFDKMISAEITRWSSVLKNTNSK